MKIEIYCKEMPMKDAIDLVVEIERLSKHPLRIMVSDDKFSDNMQITRTSFVTPEKDEDDYR